jgi:hypothetical protein
MLSYKEKVYGYCFYLRFKIILDVNTYVCNVYGSNLRINLKFKVKICGSFMFKFQD